MLLLFIELPRLILRHSSATALHWAVADHIRMSLVEICAHVIPSLMHWCMETSVGSPSMSHPP